MNSKRTYPQYSVSESPSDDELFDLYQKVITSPDGHISALRLREDFWINNGYEKILEAIKKRTEFALFDPSIRLRMEFIKRGHLNHPNCTPCGKPVMYSDKNRNISEFCSVECLYKDPNKSAKRKEDCKKVDVEAAKEKRAKTMTEKYGVAYNSQREDMKHLWRKSNLSINNPNAYEKLSNKEWMTENYIVKERSLVDIAAELGVFYGTVGCYCEKYGFEIRHGGGYSLQETEVQRFLDELGVAWKTDREVLGRKEIDILVSSHSFGIEIDGLFWHSYKANETKQQRERHLFKTLLAKENGYDLVHFTDLEWIKKQEIVKDMIKERLGLNSERSKFGIDRVELDRETAISFFDANDIQGACDFEKCYALVSDDDVLLAVAIDKPKTRQEKKYEKIVRRITPKNGVRVIEGESFLFEIISGNLAWFCDRRYSEGNNILKSGFEYSYSTDVDYFWTEVTIS